MEIISGKYETVGMINNLVNMISDKAEKKGLSFNVDIDPALPRTLYGDDGRIRQIITNILTNAVKYTNTGSVTMTVKAEDVTPNDCTLYVEVKDTGIGIKEEDLDKLFISFQRLDERKNKNIEGTGLGMSIVEGLLSMMNSRLYVESEYGKGSKFYFRLAQKIVDGAPIGEYSKTMSKEAAEIVDTGVMRCKGADILVVDDNEMNLKVAKGLMKRLDIVPDLAESGMKCIDMIRKKHYDFSKKEGGEQ
jgi:CheY-like chemotaxis protein